ncbi:MAG: alpha-L-fucosidase, partial [Opitutaceae bacterium]
MPIHRRKFIKQSVLAATTLATPRFLTKLCAAEAAPEAAAAAAPTLPPAPTPIAAPAGWGVEKGPFQPTWESLEQYKSAPDWFRDAKFGMWAHWGPQCVPEQGDWYAQRMYMPGDPGYEYHVKTYGHPSKFGFKDVVNLFKAEKWDPEHLIGIYKRAGAKYFMAMAVHHDNFDMYDSTYQPWNSVA